MGDFPPGPARPGVSLPALCLFRLDLGMGFGEARHPTNRNSALTSTLPRNRDHSPALSDLYV